MKAKRNDKAKEKIRVRAKDFVGFTRAQAELSIERFCGHEKIIRYADGLPVYTNLMPPLCSTAFANFLISLMFRILQNRMMPYLASFALTDECNANCQHCSFFTSLDDPNKTPMTAEELKNAIRQAQDLGVSVINIVGGEPLMFPQWREVFQSVDKRKSHLLMFTNGWFLAESAADLKAVGMGGVYVSLDASTAEAHDRKRGKEGLFAKAMEGINAALKADLTVGISCCIDEKDYESGELDRIIELGKRAGVHEVLVFDAIPVGKYAARDDLRGEGGVVGTSNSTWLDSLIDHVRPYNTDKSYPGVLIYSYSSSHLSRGCTSGVAQLYVSPYGEICPCDFYHPKFGSLREEKMYLIWDRMSQQMGAHGTCWTGCLSKKNKATHC